MVENIGDIIYVIPHSPESISHDSVESFLSNAQYHIEYSEIGESVGSSEIVMMGARRRSITYDGIDIEVFPCQGHGKYGKEVSAALLGYIIRKKPSIVHIHGLHQINILTLLPILGYYGIPHVLHYHGSPLSTNLKARLWYKVLATLISSNSHIAVVNRTEAQNLRQHLSSPISYTPNAIDIDVFRPIEGCVPPKAMDRSQKQLLYVGGGLEPEKGVDILIRAFAQISDKISADLNLVYGRVDEDREAVLVELSEKLNIEHCVNFIGGVRREHLPRYYNSCTGAVFPSANEGFGVVTIEALSCGTPVIATTAHAESGHLEHGKNAYVAEAGSVKSLSKMILTLCERPKEGKEMANRGRKMINDKYSLSVLNERFVNIYSGLCRCS